MTADLVARLESVADDVDPNKSPGRSHREIATEIRSIASALRSSGEAVAWRGIGTLPEDGRMVLAKCDDGRAMVYRANILARNLVGPTPEHLKFPATRWMPIPGDGLPNGKFNCPVCDGDGWVDSAPRPLCGPPRYLDDSPTPASTWRPIAEAPRDGRYVLLVHESSGGRPYAGMWCYDDKQWADERGCIRMPTHWQPLPTPPTSTKGG